MTALDPTKASALQPMPQADTSQQSASNTDTSNTGTIQGRSAAAQPTTGQVPETVVRQAIRTDEPRVEPQANLNRRVCCTRDFCCKLLIAAAITAIVAALVVGFIFAPVATGIVAIIAMMIFLCHLDNISRTPHPEFAE